MRWFVLILALALAGCCSTPRCYLARIQTSLETADPLATAAITAACKPEVAKCTGDPERCEAYTKCRTALLSYQAIRKAVGQNLVDLNRILSLLGVR